MRQALNDVFMAGRVTVVGRYGAGVKLEDR